MKWLALLALSLAACSAAEDNCQKNCIGIAYKPPTLEDRVASLERRLAYSNSELKKLIVKEDERICEADKKLQQRKRDNEKKGMFCSCGVEGNVPRLECKDATKYDTAGIIISGAAAEKWMGISN